jgi:GntR family transcriptional regulator, rspAB operon transcriptional repressor
MAEMLRVSRTPVREALLLLKRDGLLIAQGFERAVTNPTREEFVDLYICRAALERIVAERAARLAPLPRSRSWPPRSRMPGGERC